MMQHGKHIRIKMCGITRLDDALVAADAGVDALGFIFYEKSPRYISPDDMRVIMEQLPPFVDVVGVFVDKKRSEVEEIIHYCSLNYVQLHGSESVKYCERLSRKSAPCRVIKAFRVTKAMQSEDITPYAPFVAGYLLDAYVKGEPGGTGTVFDWDIITQLSMDRPYILAGGLNVDNIEQAIQLAAPSAIDVSSGVEVQPGVKDHALVREFVAKTRKAGFRE